MTEDAVVDGPERNLELLTIGAFAARARLSAKALRLYDRLGLLAPAHVDEATGASGKSPSERLHPSGAPFVQRSK